MLYRPLKEDIPTHDCGQKHEIISYSVLDSQLITKINRLWVNFLFPPSDYLKPGNPFKNLNRGRVSNIIGKTVPIFRSPETESTLCGGGSALREVKLIVLSHAIRVSF